MLKSPVHLGRGFLRVGGRIGGQNRHVGAEPAGSGGIGGPGQRQRFDGRRQNPQAKTESAGGGASADRLGGEVRASRLWPCGHSPAEHSHTDTHARHPRTCAHVRLSHTGTRARHVICAPLRDTLIQVPCATPMRDSLMRIPMCDTLIRAPCTTLHIRASAHGTPPPSGITGRGGARSGSPSALNLCPRPCLFPCRGCGRRTIRSGGSAARAAAAQSRAGAFAGRPA